MSSFSRERVLLHTMATPDEDVVGALRLARDIGLAGIELICQEGYRCGIESGSSVSSIRDIRLRAEDLGVVVGALVPYTLGLDSESPSERRAARDEYSRVIEHARELGAGGVRVLAGATWSAEQRSDAVDRFVQSCLRLVSLALQAGVSLNIENHPRTLAVHARETADLVNQIDSSAVGIIFDPTNVLREGGEPPLEAWQVSRHRARHIHAKDCVIDGRGYTPTSLGDGQVGWETLARAVNSDGYTGWISLEYERRWHPDVLLPPREGLSRSVCFLDGLDAS